MSLEVSGREEERARLKRYLKKKDWKFPNLAKDIIQKTEWPSKQDKFQDIHVKVNLWKNKDKEQSLESSERRMTPYFVGKNN